MLSLWVVIAITLVFIGRGYAVGPIIISPTIALIRTVLTGHRRAAWLAGVVGVVARCSPTSSAATVSTSAGVRCSASSAGSRSCSPQRRSSATGPSGAPRSPQHGPSRSAGRASEERLRIARELHDVLAHNISLINVQAGVGLHLMDEQPEQARRR